jgi:hypothetical protein
MDKEIAIDEELGNRQKRLKNSSELKKRGKIKWLSMKGYMKK